MKFTIQYITAVGVLFMIMGVFGLYDVMTRNLDLQIGITQVARMFTGSVFIVGAMGLGRLKEKDGSD